MSTAAMVSIGELSKASVLAALYNASAPVGVGFVEAITGPAVMDTASAQNYIDQRKGSLKFDYVYGRPIKVDLTGDSFDPRLYDCRNGGVGVARHIVEKLRKSNEVSSSYARMIHMTNLMSALYDTREGVSSRSYEGTAALFMMREFRTEKVEPDLNLADLPESPGFETGDDHLRWSADEAIKYYDEDPDLAAVVFVELVKLHKDTAWIATHEWTAAILARGYASKTDMLHAMKGFNV